MNTYIVTIKSLLGSVIAQVLVAAETPEDALENVADPVGNQTVTVEPFTADWLALNYENGVTLNS